MNDVVVIRDDQQVPVIVTEPQVVADAYGGQGSGGKGDPGGNVMAIGLFTAASSLSVPTGTDLVQTSGYSVAGKGHARYVYDAAVDSAYVTANPRTSFVTLNGRGFRLAEKIRTPFMYGVTESGADERAAIQAFADAAFASIGPEYWDFTCDVSGNGTLTIGPTVVPTFISAKASVGGNLRYTQLGTPGATIVLLNLRFYEWHGRIAAIGPGGAAFSSRTCAFGIVLDNSMRLRIIGGLTATNFWHSGVTTNPATNSSGAELGTCVFMNCGSGIPGASSLEATWSNIANSGSASSGAQRSTINVTALPPAALETYQTVGTQQLHVRIGGRLYYVYAIDRTAGTATVYPWIDSSIGSSGTLQWVIGAGLYTQGDDSNVIGVDLLVASSCGKGLGDSSLYGCRIRGTLIQSCGTEVMIGARPTGSHIGTCIDGHYGEISTEAIVVATGISSTRYSYVNSGYVIDLSKCWQIGDPRDASNNIDGGELFSPASLGGVSIVSQGRRLNGHKANIPNGLGSTITPRLQTKPPIPQVEQRNSHTINLTVEGSGEFNRLFGFSGGVIGYVGTGTNGAPTGTFTFAPPTGGTINGGAVNATVAFSGFSGPVLFECDHTDTAQLTWVVRPLCGWNGARQAASVAAPTGGTTVDTEARAQLSAVITALKNAGLMA